MVVVHDILGSITKVTFKPVDMPVGSALRQWKIQYSGMRRKFRPLGIRVGPFVCRQEGGFLWKRTFSHLQGGGGRPAPEPQGVQKEARAVPKMFPEDIIRDGGQGQKNVGSQIDMLVNTVSHMQRDLAILRDY